MNKLRNWLLSKKKLFFVKFSFIFIGIASTIWFLYASFQSLSVQPIRACELQLH